MANDNKEKVTIEKVEFTFDMFSDKPSIDKEIIKEYNDVSKNKLKREVVTYEGSNKVVLKKKLYIGFNTRVTILIISIIVLLLISGLSFFFVYKASKNYKVYFSEESSIIYKMCENEDTCLESTQAKDMLLSECNFINTNFIYNVDISDVITYDVYYYIDSDFVITDKDDDNVVLYRKNKKIVEDKPLSNNSDNIHIDENVNIDLNGYYNYVQDYIINNNVDVGSNLEFSLYLVDDKDTTKLSTISFDLTKTKFNPVITTIKKPNQSVTIEKDAWTDTNKILVIICIVCGIIVLYLIIRVCNLLIKAFYRKDKYIEAVNKLLRTYDDEIVIARDGYNSLENKRVVKVSEFKELLDAKSIINKPIVYVRVNDIKSKFIVEDVDCIYEYTIKDLDF